MNAAARAVTCAVSLSAALVGAFRYGQAHAQQSAPSQAARPATPQVPANPTAADAAARANAGDFAAAAAIADVVVKQDPKNARAWRVLGLSALRLKQGQRSVDAFLKAYDVDPTILSVVYNLGAAYAVAGDKDKAFEWLTRARSSHKVDMSAAPTDPDLASLKSDPRFASILPTPDDFKDPFVEPTKILREWDGEAAGDQFGWIARKLGDVDGDGVPDVVTSAPTKAVGGKNAGRVYAYSTKTGHELWHADGKPGDQLGTGVECAGDVNHDGIPDVIASAPGGAYAKVYSGRDGKVLLTLTPSADDHPKGSDLSFGQHASGVGDVNHDGYDDVIVGAPGSDAEGKGAGRAYVYSGKDGSILLTLSGAHEGDAFGSAVGGYADKTHVVIIAGAPTAGAAHHGRAFVYTSISKTPAFVVDADATGNALGAMFVSVPGDFNGDGVPDVYISDWSNTAKGPSTGRVYVYSGTDGKVLLTLTGETVGEGFGTSPSVAGDVDGDGIPDLIVGAWQYAGAASSGGRAYLYSGKDGHLIRTFTCRTPGDTFGFDAVTMGDIDGDGTPDFLITSGWSGVHGFHSGRVFVVSSGVKKTA
jgi:hypothetical protein